MCIIYLYFSCKSNWPPEYTRKAIVIQIFQTMSLNDIIVVRNQNNGYYNVSNAVDYAKRNDVLLAILSTFSLELRGQK